MQRWAEGLVRQERRGSDPKGLEKLLPAGREGLDSVLNVCLSRLPHGDRGLAVHRHLKSLWTEVGSWSLCGEHTVGVHWTEQLTNVPMEWDTGGQITVLGRVLWFRSRMFPQCVTCSGDG